MRAFTGKLKDFLRAKAGPPLSGENEKPIIERLRKELAKKNEQEQRLREELAKKNEQTQRLRDHIGKLREQLARKNEQLEKLPNLRRQVIDGDRQLKKLQEMVVRANLNGAETGNIRPEDIIWIIGSPRTGSTWLSRMLGELENCEVWQEPFFGVILSFRDNIANQGWIGHRNFILGERNKPIWLNYMRRMFLAVAEVWFTGHGHLVVKEPNGSVGARLVLEAFPESKVIFLVRDPRDVIASQLDAVKPDSWYGRARFESSAATAQFDPEGGSFVFSQPASEEEFVESLSRDVVASVTASQDAFDAHGGPKMFLKYEDLRVNTLDFMRDLCSTLGLGVDEGQLARAVEAYSWENLPEDTKGEGKPRRKATPGGWREDLTPEQVEVVERVTAPLIERFYPGSKSRS
jgi:hypothetical protein